MTFLQTLITIVYYLLITYVVVILVWNFTKTKKWQSEVLYVVVLIPFLLRLFRLK